MAESNLFPGARTADQEDTQNAYEKFSEIVKEGGYTLGITGSTIFGEGDDIDMLVVATDEATGSAARIANLMLVYTQRTIFYEQSEDGSNAAFVALTHDNTVLDVYVKGISDEDEK